MEIAPVRQPRVSPASPRTGRAWRTVAGLLGAALIAGVVMLPPFAAGYLFPSRGVAPASEEKSRSAALSVRPVAAPAADIDTEDRGVRDQPQGDIGTGLRDPPIAAEPPKEPTHHDASATPRNAVAAEPPSGSPPNGMLPGGALATGLLAARTSGAPGGTADPAAELALPPIAPLAMMPAAVEPELSPAASPPPRRREPLPLQTELLTSDTPAPPPGAGPGPMPGGALPAGNSGGQDRPTGGAADRHG